MCGISGIFKFDNNTVDEKILSNITDIIAHRGPDGFGYWFNNKKNLGFGHRRLSIIDLTSAGKQPMSYMGLTITFNGEIYNYLEIKKTLLQKGYNFLTGTDTEVLLALYHLKGRECLKELDGMFSFAIWDEKKEELFCARDRFGEKPFYYYHDASQFIFGSEIKQIFEAGVKKEVKEEMLHNYCATERLNSNDLKETFYKNVYQLPHSNFVVIKSNGTFHFEKYWDINYSEQNKHISLHDAINTFNELLYTSVKRRMRSDVPIGTSLSGGLDSTTIAAYICRNNQTANLNTFTASFLGFEKDETKFVKILKSKYSNINDHYVSPSDSDLILDLQTLFFHQDEPIGSTSIYAQYRVMQLAKQNNVTVLLDGQGADEYLSGYNQFWPVRLREMYASGDSSYLKEKQNVKELIGFEQNIGLNLALMIKHPNLHKRISSLKNLVSKEKNNTTKNPLSPAYFQLKGEKETDNVNWSSLNSVLYNSIFSEGLQNLLRYADRNSMAHSREVRLPFLSHKLVEFVFSLPSNYKMDNGWSKYILRKSQENFLPEEICWRKEKVGYATPQSYWMQNKKIQEIQQDNRSQLATLKIFDKDFLDTADSWKILNLAHLLS
jgi:asparagine synthase (glutamine-hydrolysing)